MDITPIPTHFSGDDKVCYFMQQREAAMLEARCLAQQQQAADLMPVSVVAMVLPRDALHDAVEIGGDDCK